MSIPRRNRYLNSFNFGWFRMYRHGMLFRWILVSGIFLVAFNLYLSHDFVPKNQSLEEYESQDEAFGHIYESQSLSLQGQFKDNQGQLKDNQRVLFASDKISQQEKLIQVQEDLFRLENRPPDTAYNLNVTVSDHLQLERSIEDTRPEVCKNRTYDIKSLPQVSVVVPFHNEALSILLRTVHSVLQRTPDWLLKEIVLIDDNSSYENLQKPLEIYIDLLPKVRLHRTRNREGLIRSRLIGANITSAPVLVFLDAHSEVNVGWLEPILETIQKSPNTIVQPFVDGIDRHTLVYSKPKQIYKGSFTWDLRYVWMRIPEYMQHGITEEGLPYWSPTLIGCAIAVDRKYFFSIGGFDDDTQIWGGENIELSFRTWMCHGTIVTLPCSRVGHVFRPLPYKMDAIWQKTWQKNLMRIADVWMDEYKKYFYSSTRIYEVRRVNYTENEIESLKKRKALREKLKCQSFRWYIDNVLPEIPYPPRDAMYHGEIVNYRTQACWEVLDDAFVSITFACYEHRLIPENLFSFNKDGLLMYRDKCIHFMYPDPVLKVDDCPEKASLEYGIWKINFHDDRWAKIEVTIQDKQGVTTTWCIMQVTSAVQTGHFRKQMAESAYCDINNLFQFWSFSYRFDYRDGTF